MGSAEEALQVAITLNPNDTNALRHLALVSLSLGKHVDAVAYFERLLTLAPDDDQSRLDLAVIFLSSQQPEQTLQHLNKISSTLRDSRKFLFYHGVALQQTGQQETGVALLQKLAQSQTAPYGDKARQVLQTLLNGANPD